MWRIIIINELGTATQCKELMRCKNERVVTGFCLSDGRKRIWFRHWINTAFLNHGSNIFDEDTDEIRVRRSVLVEATIFGHQQPFSRQRNLLKLKHINFFIKQKSSETFKVLTIYQLDRNKIQSDLSWNDIMK